MSCKRVKWLWVLGPTCPEIQAGTRVTWPLSWSIPGQGLGRLPPNGPHVGPAPTRALPLLDQHRFSTYSWEQMHAYFWLKVGFDKQNSYKNLIHDAPLALGNKWKANKKLNQQTTLLCNLFLVCVYNRWCLKYKINLDKKCTTILKRVFRASPVFLAK